MLAECSQRCPTLVGVPSITRWAEPRPSTPDDARGSARPSLRRARGLEGRSVTPVLPTANTWAWPGRRHSASAPDRNRHPPRGPGDGGARGRLAPRTCRLRDALPTALLETMHARGRAPNMGPGSRTIGYPFSGLTAMDPSPRDVPSHDREDRRSENDFERRGGRRHPGLRLARPTASRRKSRSTRRGGQDRAVSAERPLSSPCKRPTRWRRPRVGRTRPRTGSAADQSSVRQCLQSRLQVGGHDERLSTEKGNLQPFRILPGLDSNQQPSG